MSKSIMFLFLLMSSVLSKDGEVIDGFSGSGYASLDLTDGTADRLVHPHHHHERGPPDEPEFILSVQVKNVVSQQVLSQASVDVLGNYTLIASGITDSNGATMLRVPYTHSGSLTLVVSKEGYVQTPLLWKTNKMPIFSSVTVSLFCQTQGNIWLFEDTVIIKGKKSGILPPACVQFQKRLLSLPDNISSLTAYLTVPRLHYSSSTMGVTISKSGNRTAELNPVAAISVQLLLNGKDVKVTGPVQITLPLPENRKSHPLDTVPAWSFDPTTGAWVKHGLGTVKMEDNRLVWVYIAPHLGYWIAAPFPSSTGYLEYESFLDFLSYHAYLLMAILGGTLVIGIGLFGMVSCCCRSYPSKAQRKSVTGMNAALQKKDKPTCTNDEHLDISNKDSNHSADLHNSLLCQSDQPVELQITGNFNNSTGETGLAELRIFGSTVGTSEESPRSSQPPLFNKTCEIVIPVSLHENLPESLVICNKSTALIQTPNHFSSLEHELGSRFTMLPMKMVQYGDLERLVSKDTFTQTLSKSTEREERLSKETAYRESKAWTHFNKLMESVSVPGSLNEASGMSTFCGSHQGSSEQTLLELSKSKPFPHPRAWFVSLEGKPVAQVRHSVIDLRRCHLLTDSNDTSLDSGVDLNEQHQKQEPRFMKSTAQTRAICSRNMEVSSSKSGTLSTSSPEELCLKNTHNSSSVTMSRVPQESYGDDTCQEGSAPSPRVQRPRKAKHKGKSQK